MSGELSSEERVIRRLLRVNHAGEHGAVSIYSAQISVMGDQNRELHRWLKDTLDHEQRHRAAFLEAMPSRKAKPCRAMSIWKLGGWVLGASTALLGANGILACTAAVERTVHGHLRDQIEFLRKHDPDLALLVENILEEELGHLAFAEQRLAARNLTARLLQPIVKSCTEIMIALSTRGDSFRLKAALRN